MQSPKGKGSTPKGRNSLLFIFVFFKGSKGKRKRISKGKGKEKLGKYTDHRKGKGSKGKDDTCHYCKQVGRYKAQWPKHAALTSKTSYERIRAKIPNEKSYVYDLREDSVDTDVCGSCLT